jgi:hypothetical protein
MTLTRRGRALHSTAVALAVYAYTWWLLNNPATALTLTLAACALTCAAAWTWDRATTPVQPGRRDGLLDNGGRS